MFFRCTAIPEVVCVSQILFPTPLLPNPMGDASEQPPDRLYSLYGAFCKTLQD